MGRLVYGAVAQSFDIEDRALAHLRIVLSNKLRRSEPFFLHLPSTDGTGARSIWMHPAVPITLHFFGSRAPSINRAWLDSLMDEASGPHGLSMGPEPTEA